MVTLLALGAALAYGVADFLGGAVSRRTSALKALAWCVPVGLAVILAAALVIGGRFTWTSLAWGFGAGLAGGTGLITFYRALARGPMSVVAPVSALAAAVLPVGVGTLRGEQLDAPVLAGVLLCLVAIGLISMENNTPTATGASPNPSASPEAAASTDGRVAGMPAWSARLADSGPLMAGISGVCFGIFFIMLKGAGDASGLWPVVAARVGNLCVIGAALAVMIWARGADLGPPVSGRLLIGLAVLSGTLDASANALYFVAAQQGMLSLAAVLTSLYPAITVLLARIAYSERLRVVQRLGLAIAAAGVALVTIG
ncbi:EamA family transporter [Actinomadura rugatobispora]|uniref:EamA family transporter n=1 Tax=Actinomadura rugatobispora TaxID=1994 RepID=A0ABW0ZRI9_9ACTN|nr:EamA family transporter [Actinomadura rugatobispora]